MELTVDQALQEGIAAHKEGKLQDAERLYRAILDAQPRHPDANHNLGVLAVEVGKPLEAIPLFKLALEGNPQSEQFWLRYVEALVLTQRSDEVRQALEDGKRAGVRSKKLAALWEQNHRTSSSTGKKAKQGLSLSEKRQKLAEKKRIKKNSVQGSSAPPGPSRDQVDRLVEHYQSGRLKEAEQLAVSFTREFPDHPFGWKVLSAAIKQTGRPTEALSPMLKFIQLSPHDAEAHYNLGVTLQELGRFEEAGARYRQAISLEPGFAEAHNNLGMTFQKMGKLSNAEASYRKAVALKPSYVDAHYNLGIMLQHLNKLDEAEASYRQVITLNPDYYEAHSNLGNTLRKLNRLDEAEISYEQAIIVKPDYAEAHNDLGVTLKDLGKLAEAEASYRKAIEITPDYPEAHYNLGITLHDLGRLRDAESSYRHAITLKPGYSEAHNNLGLMLKRLHRYQEAISHFDLANNPMAVPESLECLYITENYDLVLKRLNKFSKSKGTNIGVAAISAFVSHQLKTQDPYEFCKKPLDYISVSNAREFEGNAHDLIKDILAESGTYQLNWESRTTKFGFQGPGDIFVNPSSAVSNLERIIGQALTKYYDNHRAASERFITAWPAKYKLVGWFNRLVANGYQISHIHPTGWLSGVIYLKTTPPSNNNAGAIEFSLHGHELPIIDENIPRQIHNPQEGDIVLFPSSLFHKTIPFITDTERCVIAFDMQPAVDPT